MLAGGGDVDPARYGAEPHPPVYGVDPERDTTELELAAAALALGVPTLAICRGLQVLNVARGGTLEQHLPDRLGTDPRRPGGGRSATHDVRVAPGSRLASRGGRRSGSSAAPPTTTRGWPTSATASSPSAGRPTASSRRSSRRPTAWFVAVQWHPEATAADDPAQQALFDAFAAEVRARAAAG